jgi:dTDP-4-amino-4,6-dideoxygalactose transaminase
MVDIDEETLNIDPRKIEAAITVRTKAIVAAHVYGNPCDVRAIEEIANRYELPVIYDGSQAFGSMIGGRSVFASGDVSTTSFDSMKLFHTIEGGAVFTSKPEVLRRLALMRNFGLVNAETIESVGINGKNCEFHAAMGLANLPRVGEILARRKALAAHYDSRLAGAPLRRPSVLPGCDWNFAYYPVIFDDEETLLEAVDELHLHDVEPRRYFYPALSTLDFVGTQSTPIAEALSSRVLALPMYHDLTFADVDLIAEAIVRTCRYHGRRPWVPLTAVELPPSAATP